MSNIISDTLNPKKYSMKVYIKLIFYTGEAIRDSHKIHSQILSSLNKYLNSIYFIKDNINKYII